MSNRVDMKILTVCKDYCERLVKVCEAIEGGMYTRNACEKFDINVGRFRNLLKISANEHYKSSEVQEHLDYSVTPQERFLQDLFQSRDYAYVPDDFNEALDITLSTLSDRESKIIRDYYFNEKTLEEIAKMFSITTERVRQIVVKGMQRLRHPSRLRLFKEGVSFYEAKCELNKLRAEYLSSREEAKAIINDEMNNLRSLLKINSDSTSLNTKLLDAGFTSISDVVKGIGDILKLDLTDVEKESLHKLLSDFCKGETVPSVTSESSIADLNLSARAYNCLIRSNIRTIGDLTKLTLSDLMMIRNLGRKSLDEILNVLEHCGLKLTDK